MHTYVVSCPSCTKNLEWYLTKGAPEKLEELCLPHTLPHDFHAKLKHLTLKGTVFNFASSMEIAFL
jgi:hypothetical protein